MQRTGKQQQPQHALKQRVREINRRDLCADGFLDAHGGPDGVQTDDGQRGDERHDQDADCGGQFQKQVVDGPEGPRQNDEQGGDLKEGHGQAFCDGVACV